MLSVENNPPDDMFAKGRGVWGGASCLVITNIFVLRKAGDI